MNENKQGLDRNGKRQMVRVAISFVLSGVILFWCAGRLDWLEGWIYWGGALAIAVVMGTMVARKNPEVINERGRKLSGTKRWDKVILWTIMPMAYFIPVVAGLDERFGLSSVPRSIQMLALAGLVLGMFLPYLAMLNNPFLAPTVRIQHERGHRVATTGPYQFVRHPMYTGIVLSWSCAPLFLGSWWALIPGGLGILGLVVRTVLEDHTLREELSGYVDYAARVRYRL